MMIIKGRVVHPLLCLIVIRYADFSLRAITHVKARVVCPRTVAHPTKLILTSLQGHS